jgi:hypothetical protein
MRRASFIYMSPVLPVSSALRASIIAKSDIVSAQLLVRSECAQTPRVLDHLRFVVLWLPLWRRTFNRVLSYCFACAFQ